VKLGGSFGLFFKPNIKIKRPTVITRASTIKNIRISLGYGLLEIIKPGRMFPRIIDAVLASTAIDMIVGID
jgi:hypothetical protein